MEVRFRNYLILMVVFLVGIATAAAVILGGDALQDPGGPPNADQVVGVVVRVDSEGLTDVRGFTLRTDTDSDMPFVLDQLENGAEFPPGHLVEHQAASTPLRVYFRTVDGINHAIYLEDAEQTG